MKLQKQSILAWYLIICLQFVIVSISLFFGMHELLWNNDQTKISLLIISIWLFTTPYIGFLFTSVDKYFIINKSKIGWYLSETCLALGLLGTVIGFLLMLGNAFVDIDVTNTSSLQESLVSMSLGMSTSLFTTLTGIVASIFLKSQLVNLEHYSDGL